MHEFGDLDPSPADVYNNLAKDFRFLRFLS